MGRHTVRRLITIPFLFAVAFGAEPRPRPFEGRNPRQAAALRVNTLQHEVSVTLKLIQVIVTDKDGNPVTDLTREDFSLTDNGRAIKLTEFERHVLDLTPPAGRPLTARLVPVRDAAPPAPPPSAAPRLNRKFFLFFDFAYNNPGGVRSMREAALRFLEGPLAPTDEIGVLSYSPLKLLQIHIPLTTDHAKVRELVDRIGLRDAADRFEDLEDKYQRELAAGGLADARPEAPADLPRFNFQDMWAMSTITYINSMTALAYALRPVEGQKHLLLFSEGIPYRVIYGQYVASRSELRIKHENLLKELQSSNVSVHALYTGGLTIVPAPETGVWTLDKTAFETGGRFWGNVYNAEPFMRLIQKTTGSYYVLGYPVTDAWDGRYHRIHVTVRRPGVEVRSQWGYANPRPFPKYSELEKKILLVDLALAAKPISQIPAEFPMEALPFPGDAAGNVLIVARIPRDCLDDVMGRDVEVVGLVFDAADRIVLERRRLEDLSGLTPMGAVAVSLVTVPPGTHRLRVILRNLETGSAARGGVTLEVPAAPAPGLNLCPPVLWVEAPGARCFDAFAPPKASGRAGPIPAVEVLGVDPRLRAPLLERKLAAASELRVSIRCAAPGESAAGVKIAAGLEDLEFGGRLDLPLQILAETAEGEVHSWFLRLTIPNVEPGEYRLHFRAEEAGSGRTAVIARDFEIGRAGDSDEEIASHSPFLEDGGLRPLLRSGRPAFLNPRGGPP